MCNYRTQQVFSNSLFQTKPKVLLIYEFHVSVGNFIGIIYLESRLFFAKTQSFWETWHYQLILLEVSVSPSNKLPRGLRSSKQTKSGNLARSGGTLVQSQPFWNSQRIINSSPDWVRVQGQPDLHSKTLFQKSQGLGPNTWLLGRMAD